MAKPLFLCILSSIIIQSSAIDAQKNGKVAIGQSLSANTKGSSLVSEKGDFAFGFHPFNNSSDLFLLAIWYAKIPDTIVWYANRGNPVPQESIVTLTADKGLVLSNPRGIILWNTSDLIDTISFGFMNDTGNFALKSSNNEVVWDSFGHPKDTLLPTQELEIGGVNELNSRLSETNFTNGRFQLRLLNDGNLVLNTRDLATSFAYTGYYASATTAPASPGQKVVFNESGYAYILTENNKKYDLLPQEKVVFSPKYYYLKATLNFDGVLTWYYIQKAYNGSGWTPIYSLPDNICLPMGDERGGGPCGFNIICTLSEYQRPICECPQNYSLRDPNDTYGSCKPDFIPDECDGYGQNAVKGEYTMAQLLDTDWPYGPCSEEDCKNSCLDDCFCAAAIFRGGGGTGSCAKKKLPLSNGRRNNTGTTAWLKVGDGNYSSDPHKPFTPSILKDKNKKNTLVYVLFGASVFVNLFQLSAIGLGIFILCRKRRFRWLDGGQSRRNLGEFSKITCFSYKDLKRATNGFKEEIGRGAFGIVYKGIIGVGGAESVIAVKKLDRISRSADNEFRNEVNVIGQTHHRNLVRLIGYCKEQDQRILVYEYMSNGSLADYLFSDLKPSWPERVQIAQGIARGIFYLHDECSTQIIHCDIKPQNILLDDCNITRIADFGLAKLLDLNQTQTNTAIRGTKGYVAPEWFRNKPVTVKVDVYSFGVLLLEIICCRKSVCLEMSGDAKAILTDWAFDCYRYGRLDSLVTDDLEALNDRQQL